MLLKEIAGSEYKVKRFPMYFGRRSKEFEKQIWNPFINELAAVMKSFGGKWNGQDGYVFKKEDKAAEAQKAMDEFASKWKEIEKANPEGAANIDAAVADAFFKHAKASKNPNSK